MHDPDREPTSSQEITITRHVFSEVYPEYCGFLPLPPVTSKSWEVLFDIGQIFQKMSEINIVVDADRGIEKTFVMYRFGAGDKRIQLLKEFLDKNNLPESDAGVVYDLLSVTKKMFTFKYYQKYNRKGFDGWEYLPDINHDFDEALWHEFEQKRQNFLELYYKDIDFDSRFFMVNKIQIGGYDVPINPDVLVISGFTSWWIGPTRSCSWELEDDDVEESQNSPFSDALYIPQNPTVDSFAEFIEKNGMALWQILDESFARDQEGLWSFVFSKKAIFDFHASGFFTDSVRMKQSGFDDQYLFDQTLIQKIIPHLAGLWDLARIIRYFKNKKNDKLESAFRTLYEQRVEKFKRTISGEDLLSVLAAKGQARDNTISSVGTIPGYDDEDEEPIDPKEKRLSKQLNVVNLSKLFSNPSAIQSILENSSEIDLLNTITIDTSERIIYRSEADLVDAVLDLAYLPLDTIKK